MLKRFLLCVFAASLVVALRADEDVLRPKGRPEPSSRPPTQGIVRGPWALGVELGGSLSFFGQDVTQYQAPTYQTNLTSGSGLGPLLNLAVDYALTDALGIQARLGYDQKHFTHQRIPGLAMRNSARKWAIHSHASRTHNFPNDRVLDGRCCTSLSLRGKLDDPCWRDLPQPK